MTEKQPTPKPAQVYYPKFGPRLRILRDTKPVTADCVHVTRADMGWEGRGPLDRSWLPGEGAE